MTLIFDLAGSPDQRRQIGSRLVELVAADGYRIGTGFLGAPLVCDALCQAGEVETAYRLLLQRDLPSWLYPVTMGATSIWERWDGVLPDGRINPANASLNHFAFGAVVDWLHRSVAGLAPAAPGYRRIRFQPLLGFGLSSASACHLTPYGMAAIAWKVVGDQLHVEVEVPANTRGDVILPDGSMDEVRSGRHQWTVRAPRATEND